MVLGGVGVLLASAGTIALVKASGAKSAYNAYVPGDPGFDAATPAARQDRFDKLRSNYTAANAIGWACIGLLAADALYFTLTVRF